MLFKRLHTSGKVKGGAKLDHWGGEKLDRFIGGSGCRLRDLRGRLERRPATRFAGSVYRTHRLRTSINTAASQGMRVLPFDSVFANAIQMTVPQVESEDPRKVERARFLADQRT